MDYHPIRRWSSWYDRHLVIEAGEKILTSYDTPAIRELKRLKLIWSSWDTLPILSADDHYVIPDSPHGVRRIRGVDSKRLRLFFLSLLWRMAATDLFEFSDVVLPESDIEVLRTMVLSGESAPLEFYPAELIQLSTKGVVHNHSPILDEKRIPTFGNVVGRLESIFRFYFDGLVCHISRQSSDSGKTKEKGNLIVGNSDQLYVSTVTFEASLQAKILGEIMADAYSRWPDAERL